MPFRELMRHRKLEAMEQWIIAAGSLLPKDLPADQVIDILHNTPRSELRGYLALANRSDHLGKLLAAYPETWVPFVRLDLVAILYAAYLAGICPDDLGTWFFKNFPSNYRKMATDMLNATMANAPLIHKALFCSKEE